MKLWRTDDQIDYLLACETRGLEAGLVGQEDDRSSREKWKASHTMAAKSDQVGINVYERGRRWKNNLWAEADESQRAYRLQAHAEMPLYDKSTQVWLDPE